MATIGIFGSAFGPPTKGHASLIAQAMDKYSEIWMIPAYRHGFGKVMFDYKFRCELTSAFARDLGDAKCIAKCIEHHINDVDNKGFVGTWSLMNFIQNKLDSNNDPRKIEFIMGPDNYRQFDKFYKSNDILKKWNLFVGIEDSDIRSTSVRNKIANNEDFSDLVTPGVNDLLNLHIEYLKSFIFEQKIKHGSQEITSV